MKKRVLIVITTGFDYYGGLTTAVMNYYRVLDKNLYLVDFASTNENVDQKLIDEIEANGSKYYCLGDRKKHLMLYIGNLNKLLKNNYDIIHINANSATAAIELAIAKINGIPKRIVHNHTSSCDHKIMHTLLYPFYTRLYTDAIAVSKKAGEWIFPNNQFTILKNGINSEKYRFNKEHRIDIRKKYNISPETIVIGHVGKIYKPKNHEFLIDIFEEYNKITINSVLLLVGDGELKNKIKDIVIKKKLDNKVIFCGMQKDVEKYLSAIDVFVFPSLWEGMPLSLIEAQASGLHCVISDQIDGDVCITQGVIPLSLECKAQTWASTIADISISNRELDSDDYIRSIKQNGYDTFFNIKELENIYNYEEVKL